MFHSTLQRFVTPILMESHQEMTSGGLALRSYAANLYIQAKVFRSTDLRFQYPALTRRTSDITVDSNPASHIRSHVFYLWVATRPSSSALPILKNLGYFRNGQTIHFSPFLELKIFRGKDLTKEEKWKSNSSLPKASKIVFASKICCSIHVETFVVTVHRYCRMNLVVSV